MCSREVSLQIRKAREFIAHFRREIEESVAIRTFLLSANGNREAGASTNRTVELHKLIGKALLQRQLMLLMRLYDHESRDRACLKRLFSLLDIPEVCQAVAAPGSESTIAAAREFWEALRNDSRQNSLRKIRDRVSAHNILEGQSDLDPVSYNDFWSFSQDTERLIEYLATGSGIVRVRLAAVEQVWSRRAQEYWNRLT